jgi:hypothetical protein
MDTVKVDMGEDKPSVHVEQQSHEMGVDVDMPRSPNSSTDEEKSVEKPTIRHQIWNWIPPPSRYDPDKPPTFSTALNLLFAFVSASAYSSRLISLG